ncbi:MAG TPA: 2-succinyl-5-enolpyruvyl-6-hydroxy-3-cyclohexene-1-carboxylic-acid synthase, partial [Pirellulaceae bacterium]
MNSDDSGAADPGDLNSSWSQRVISTLVADGVRDFFLAPGSRSTPLVLALNRVAGVRLHTHFDERGLAFACLGFGRGAGRPAVFLCTSGTAVANAFPAVIEARLEHVPMLLLTADRPPELRETGANQTIRQPAIFGDYPVWSMDVPCPDPHISQRFITSTFRHAVECAATGPVHLNCMFREPFVLPESLSYPASEAREFPPARFRVATRTAPQKPVCLAGGATLVIAGRCLPHESDAAEEFCARTGAVLLHDLGSPGRGLPFEPALISDRVPRPRTVIHIGGRLVSSRWWRFLAAHPPDCHVHISRHGDRLNPEHAEITRIAADVGPTLAECSLAAPCPAEFQRAWLDIQRQTWQMARTTILSSPEITEPAIAITVCDLLPAHHALFVGNSMPIRDFDLWGALVRHDKHGTPPAADLASGWEQEPNEQDDAGRQRGPSIVANRGASGIDGNLATACGYAWGSGRSTTAVVGDLALLHDLNSLALLRQGGPPLQVVVLNNDGGGIFHFLPVADQVAEFEQLFVMPHGLPDFRAAAELFGLRYKSATSMTEFRQAYSQALASDRSTLLEVRTNRATNRELHR